MKKLVLSVIVICIAVGAAYAAAELSSDTPVPDFQKLLRPHFADGKDSVSSESAATDYMADKCRKLSEQEGVEYEFLSGEVLSTSVLPPRWADCFRTPGGCWGGQGTFVARLKRLNNSDADSDDVFFVHTKLEPASALYKNDLPYMEQGNRYSFCATEIDTVDFSNAKDLSRISKYRIDFVKTINNQILERPDE